jgi:hypothetical protein
MEQLTTADEIEYMSIAYQSQRGTRPRVAMCPATWAIVAGIFDGWSDEKSGPTVLRVMLAEEHDPSTITFFDDVRDVSLAR